MSDVASRMPIAVLVVVATLAMSGLTVAAAVFAEDAWAAVIKGTPNDDHLQGANDEDNMHGFAGDDFMSGGNGDDTMDGGPGEDILEGGNFDDFIDAVDGERDEVSCGLHNDVVEADAIDEVSFDCETVNVRWLSSIEERKKGAATVRRR